MVILDLAFANHEENISPFYWVMDKADYACANSPFAVEVKPHTPRRSNR